MARRSDHTREQLRELILQATTDLIRESGISALSSRKVATRVGYTVGTIFQVFGSMDRLILHTNIRTLDALYDACSDVASSNDTETRLRNLAQAFLTFARENQNLWDAVISYQYSQSDWQDEDYEDRNQKLLGLIGSAISDTYGPDDSDQLAADVRLLWTALYGVFALASADRLAKDFGSERLISGLIDMYLAARRSA